VTKPILTISEQQLSANSICKYMVKRAAFI